MTRDQILRIVDRKAVAHPTEGLELIETHASWVLLGDTYVYKVKKPLRFSFLDFSTLEKRQTSCELEVVLNHRLAPEMYLGVLPVFEGKDQVQIGGEGSRIVDYAVWMHRMDEQRQMDLLVAQDRVSGQVMEELAKVLAQFHLEANKVLNSETWEDLYEEFEDISGVRPFLESTYGVQTGALILEINQWVYDFLHKVEQRIEERKQKGFVVDGHGDLHCRNIFLLDRPVIFDCIEFNESFRTLDMLNEVAFLCMDLERFGRTDLARIFINQYQVLAGVFENETDQQLFLYYKMYRANVRIKVHCLHQLEGTGTSKENKQELDLIGRYLELFKDYYFELRGEVGKVDRD
ncbi:MAG: phosphotransferase [Robiginitalea sp.]